MPFITKDGLNKRLTDLERRVCCHRTLFYDNFAAFPVEGKIETLYVDESTGAVYIWDGDSYISNFIPTTLNEYDTHAEALADITLLNGNFYVLSEANLEGASSIGQGGPFYRKI